MLDVGERDVVSLMSLNPESVIPLPHCFRWYLISLQAFYSFASSVAIMCFFPLVPQVAHDMRVDTSSMTILITTTWMVAALSKIPATWYVERSGPLPNVIIAVIAIVIGSLIRVVPHNFPLLCVGTITCQVGQTFTQVLPALITELYFPNGEKALSTSIGVVAEYFGAGMGMFVGSLFVTSDSVLGLCYLTGLLPLCGLPLFFFVWWKVENRSATNNISIYTSVKELFGNRLFVLSFCALSITFGVFNVLLSNISLMAPPSLRELTGVYALTLFSSGMLGAAIIGHIVDKRSVEILLAIRACAALCFILMFIQCFFWVNDWRWCVLVMTALMGFFGPSLPSLMMRYLIESIDCAGTEPVMNSLLLISYAIVASILTPLCTPHVLHLEEPNNVYIIWVLLTLAIPGVVFVYCLRAPVDKPRRGRELQTVGNTTSTTNLLTSTASAESSDPDILLQGKHSSPNAV